LDCSSWVTNIKTTEKPNNEKTQKYITYAVAIIAIILIIALYTYPKIPYLEYEFTGEHRTKYTTYVEPASQHEPEQQPFHAAKTYMTNFTNNYGTFPMFRECRFLNGPCCNLQDIS
jgi:hypothetical protein